MATLYPFEGRPYRALWAAAAVAAAACGPGPAPAPPVPSGPPEVVAASVARHAAELDDDIGPRPAGSQREQAAAVYITGHLQQAGYVVRLDPVPVGDLVRSTNVEALAPGGGPPDAVVVAAYDAPEQDARGGAAVGLLLELARALRVAAPGADVQFVALGAEHGREPRLGARRLARALLDAGAEPIVVELGDIALDGPAAALGAGAGRIAPGGPRADPPDVDVFTAAGFDRVVVAGGAGEAGTALLEYLSGAVPVR